MPDSARLYSGRSADERDAERRTRLLGAGRTLFGTLGYAATPVERLCSEAKVSTRHFYLLFGNKEDAFLAVYDEINAAAIERTLAAMERTAGRPIHDRLPDALVAYLGPMIEDPLAARIAFLEVMGASPRVEARRLEQRETLIAMISAEGTAAVARGEISDRDFRLATLALAGAANAIVYDWAAAGATGPVGRLEEYLVGLALQLLTG